MLETLDYPSLMEYDSNGNFVLPGGAGPAPTPAGGWPTVANQGAGGGGQSTQSVLNWLSSPGGAAAINAGGAGLAAYGQAQNNAANRQETALEAAARMRQLQYNTDRAANMAKAGGVLEADPLGAQQTYAQKNALLASILPGLRNAKSHPGDPAVAAAMGTREGGVANFLPGNGLDPTMIANMFGPNATMGAITRRNQELSNLDSRAPTGGLKSMYGDSAAPYQSQIDDWASQLRTMDESQKAAFEKDMQGYINKMVDQENKQNDGSGFWHKFARIAAIVGAAAATYFSAGAASPLMAAAIGIGGGAAAGAAGSWGAGGDPGAGAVGGAVGGAASTFASRRDN